MASQCSSSGGTRPAPLLSLPPSSLHAHESREQGNSSSSALASCSCSPPYTPGTSSGASGVSSCSYLSHVPASAVPSSGCPFGRPPAISPLCSAPLLLAQSLQQFLGALPHLHPKSLELALPLLPSWRLGRYHIILCQPPRQRSEQAPNFMHCDNNKKGIQCCMFDENCKCLVLF